LHSGIVYNRFRAISRCAYGNLIYFYKLLSSINTKL